MLKLLGISGSIRTESHNTYLLRSAQSLLPSGCELKISEHFTNLPITYFDEEKGVDQPEVKKFRSEIVSADAILFSTPQFNYNIPTVLINGLEWGAKYQQKNVWQGKRYAVIGASMDSMGTEKARAHLKEKTLSLGMNPFSDDISLVNVEALFTGTTLTDQHTLKQIKEFLNAFIVWLRK